MDNRVESPPPRKFRLNGVRDSLALYTFENSKKHIKISLDSDSFLE